MQTFAKQIEKLVSEILNAESVTVQETPADKAGDYGVPFFAFAKKLGKNPAELAQEFAENLNKNLPTWLAKVEATGPFVNFFLSEKVWTDVVQEALDSDLFASESGAGETIVVDYGGENVAKPQSVGHLRSNIIGQAFVNCAKKSGYKVIGDNHLGDWGSQFGKLLTEIAILSDNSKNKNLKSAEKMIKKGETDSEEFSQKILDGWKFLKERYKNLKNNKFPLEKILIEVLLETYVNINKKITEKDKNKALSQQLLNASRTQFRKLSDNDPILTEIWKEMVDITIANLKDTYDRLGISFDHFYGESFYRGAKMEQAANLCEKNNLVTKNPDGSWAIVPPEDTNLSSFLIRKSDGATLYHTSDLAAIRYRLDTWQPSRIVYFVAEPQSLHFRQLFWLAEQLGWTKKTKLEHAVFGMVTLPTGQMSTRKGNVVKLEDLLNEAHAQALKILDEKQPDLAKAEKEKLAEQVGVGAVIYEDLSRDRTKNIAFDWQTALNFEGQSAPYIQYTYARALSILRKTEVVPTVVSFDNPYEIALTKKFLLAQEVVQKVVAEAKPSYLAQWLYDLANDFNKFYANVPVLKSEGEALASRLALVKATTQILKEGLKLLGIKAPEQM